MLAVLFFLFFAMLSCNGLYTKYILSAFGVSLCFKECLFLSVASALMNYVTFFRGGAGIRALYLKTNYRLSFSDFLSTLSATYLMCLMVNCAVGILGMMLLLRKGFLFDAPLVVLFVLPASFSSVLMLFRIRLPESDNFPLHQIARIINGWDMIRKNKGLFVKLMVNTVLYSFLIILQTKVAFSAYGVNLSWESAMCFSAAKSLALLATITPGALGIVEWLSAYLGQTLAYSASEGLMAQGLMRTVTITTLLITGPFAVRYIGKKFLEKNDL